MQVEGVLVATLISTVYQLQNMGNDLAGDYELGSDIDASITSGWNEDPENPGTYFGFVPVGTYASGQPELAFTGSFDGKGYKITGLYMNRPIAVGAPDCNFQALFGYTWASGEIKNVQILDCNITAFEWVGALVGFHSPNCDKVSNCFSTGVIKALVGVGGLFGYNGVEVELSDSQCEIICEGGADASIEEVGGLIGENDGKLTDCHATGDITCTSDWDIWGVGGLLGLDSGEDSMRCYATGNISAVAGITGQWNMILGIGGFAGYIDTDLTKDCYARGNVHAEHPTDGSGIGGFVGSHNYFQHTDKIDNCYATGEVTTVGAFTLVGGFSGEISGAGVITPECFWDTETSGQSASAGNEVGKTTAQMKTKSTFTDAGWDFFLVWGITALINDGYPFFRPARDAYFAWII